MTMAEQAQAAYRDGGEAELAEWMWRHEDALAEMSVKTGWCGYAAFYYFPDDSSWQIETLGELGVTEGGHRSPTYSPNGYGECPQLDSTTAETPCWGRVEIVDEICNEDYSDCWLIHACGGHAEACSGRAYIAEEPS